MTRSYSWPCRAWADFCVAGMTRSYSWPCRAWADFCVAGMTRSYRWPCRVCADFCVAGMTRSYRWPCRAWADFCAVGMTRTYMCARLSKTLIAHSLRLRSSITKTLSAVGFVLGVVAFEEHNAAVIFIGQNVGGNAV